jgi:hypothetical protein
MQNENSKKTRFQKGNTYGSGTQRTKGIATHINEKTNNLKDIVDKLWELFINKSVSVANRIKIAEYLAGYAVGKPTQRSEVEIDMPEPIVYVPVKKDETNTGN